MEKDLGRQLQDLTHTITNTLACGHTYTLNVDLKELLEDTIGLLQCAAKTDLNQEGAVDQQLFEIQQVIQQLL